MLCLIFSFLLYLSPQYTGNYQASLLDKISRLENTDSPKIVLIGNSNLAFGIDSEELEREFRMPVINMGLHGGLGNAFHEKVSLTNIREGDIYIICHNTYHDDGTIPDPDLAWITIEDHFFLWKMLCREDIKPMFYAYPAYLKRCISLWLTDSGNRDYGDNVYTRSAFNEYGDIEWDDDGQIYEFKPGDITLPQISNNVILRLNELNTYLTDQGATLLLAGYPIADTVDRPSDEMFRSFRQELAKQMDAPVISDYTDYIYPESYFFDTSFHLNTNGKKARTQQLIKDLQAYLYHSG